eukprot:g4690.t1
MPGFSLESSDSIAKAELSAVMERIPDLSGKQVLELGCKSGRFTSHLAVEAASVLSVDSNGAMLDRARAQVSEKRIDFMLGDALTLDFPPASFDVVVSAQWNLEHLEPKDRTKVVNKVRRWLRPDGLFFLRETCAENANNGDLMSPSSFLSALTDGLKGWGVLQSGVLPVLDSRSLDENLGTFEMFWIAGTKQNTDEIDSKKAKNIGLSGDGKTNDVWEDAELPRVWRDAMYTGKCEVMTNLFHAEVDVVESLLKEVSTRNGIDKSVLIEVGCGTAELLAAISKRDTASKLIGVELSSHMLNLAVEIHPSALGSAENVTLIKGNAMKLRDVLSASRILQESDYERGKVVAVVMNTFGIFPESIREIVISEMVKAAGNGGIVVLGCWWGEQFRTGVEMFYKKNPKLCGTVKDEHCDFENANLFVPSTKYSSHWWRANELNALFAPHKNVKVEIRTSGIGIFAIARIIGCVNL